MSDSIPQSLIELQRLTKPREMATGYLKHYRDDLLQALNYPSIRAPQGGILTEESFIASVNLEVATNPRVAEAMMSSPASFMKAILLAAQCKLLVGSSYDLFYLVPRKNRGRLEVTPLTGYKGLADMVQRHPRVHSIEAILVFEGDEWEYDAGAGKMRHIVKLDAERDEEHMVGGYAKAIITEPQSTHPVVEAPIFHVMNRKQLLAIKARSDAFRYAEGGKKDSAWHTDPLPMHSKTLLRALVNGGKVPKDMGIGGVISAEDAATTPARAVVDAEPKSRAESIRGALGIDPSKPVIIGETRYSDDTVPFDLVEEAVAALDDCETVEEMEALRDRFQHFQGEDASTIAAAWERNEDRLNA